jgi:hypothetical protein
MTSDYYENGKSTSQPFEELQPVVTIHENQSIDATSSNKYIHSHENVKNRETNDHELLSSLYPISTDDFNELSFDPKEWLITDTITGRDRPPRQNEFLLLLLENSYYSSYLSWLNKNEGLFKIHKPERIAILWTRVKNRQTNGIMNYKTFARGIRYYYQSGSMIKTNKKHTFRFKLPINSPS